MTNISEQALNVSWKDAWDDDEGDEKPMVFTRPEMKNLLELIGRAGGEPLLNPGAAQRCSELAQQGFTDDDVIAVLAMVERRDERPILIRHMLDCLQLSVEAQIAALLAAVKGA
jgi:hypothetical protein